MTKKPDILITLLAIVFMIFAFAKIVSVIAETPIVYISHSGGYCVRVYDPTNRFDCENLPNRYETEWVK